MMDWDALYEACMSCQKCGLAETRHNVVFGEGPRDAEVMFIGEGPGEQEDRLTIYCTLGSLQICRFRYLCSKIKGNIPCIHAEKKYIFDC